MLTLVGIVLGWPIVFAAGLVVGWFFLPVPGFVRRLFGR